MLKFFANKTAANEYYKVWTNNNHPEEIYSEAFMMSKLNYIHNNPFRAGIVADAEHYLYCSAANYAGQKGIIEIDYLF